MNEDKEDVLTYIQEALERISCSLAGINGTLDRIFVEVMNEKKEEERIARESVQSLKHEENT